MKTLTLHNDLELVFALLKRAPGGLRVPATGLLGLTVYFSLKDAGATISSDTVTTLTEDPNLPGTYTGIIDGGGLASDLANVTVAYRVLMLSGNLLASDAYRVDAVRRLDG